MALALYVYNIIVKKEKLLVAALRLAVLLLLSPGHQVIQLLRSLPGQPSSGSERKCRLWWTCWSVRAGH